MILPFSVERVLTRVAVSDHTHERLPARLDVSSVRHSSGPMSGLGTVQPGRGRRLLERLIEVAVVGEPEQLRHALAADATGWSPSWQFGSRSEAEAALRNHTAPLLVTEFDAESLFWSPPYLSAEWTLRAVHAEPFFVADDWLIDVNDDPVSLVGCSILKLRGQEIGVVHTYYDEASLIEQVVLRATSSAESRPGDHSFLDDGAHSHKPN